MNRSITQILHGISFNNVLTYARCSMLMFATYISHSRLLWKTCTAGATGNDFGQPGGGEIGSQTFAAHMVPAENDGFWCFDDWLCRWILTTLLFQVCLILTLHVLGNVSLVHASVLFSHRGETKWVYTGRCLTYTRWWSLSFLSLWIREYVGPRNVWFEEVHPVVLWCKSPTLTSHCVTQENIFGTKENISTILHEGGNSLVKCHFQKMVVRVRTSRVLDWVARGIRPCQKECEGVWAGWKVQTICSGKLSSVLEAVLYKLAGRKATQVIPAHRTSLAHVHLAR